MMAALALDGSTGVADDRGEDDDPDDGNELPTFSLPGAEGIPRVSAQPRLRLAGIGGRDLIRRDYPVFRSLLPHAGCDLVILDDDGRAIRIDVQAAYRRANGPSRPRQGP